MQKSEQTKAIEKNRKTMLDAYQWDASSIFDIGTHINEDFVPNKKAQIIVNMFLNKHIGFKLEYSNLINKQWKKWTWDSKTFKQNELLKPSDIKEAIKAFYLMSYKKEVQFADGVSKMLVFEKTRIDDKKFIYELKLVEFKEVFKVIQKTEQKTKTLKEKLEALLSDDLTEQEKNAISEAIKILNCKLIKKAS